MDTTAVIFGDVAGIGTGNVAAGIHGRTTAVDVFANVCGPCAFALGCMRRTAVQEFADWSRDLCMLALSLRWAKLRWMCISLQQLALTTQRKHQADSLRKRPSTTVRTREQCHQTLKFRLNFQRMSC